MSEELGGSATMHYLPRSVTLSEIGGYSCLNLGFNYSKGKLGRALLPLVSFKRPVSAIDHLLIPSSAFEIVVKNFHNKNAFEHKFESIGINAQNCPISSDTIVNPRNSVTSDASAYNSRFQLHWCGAKFPMWRYSMAKPEEDIIQLNDLFLSRCKDLLKKAFVCRNDVQELWDEFGEFYVHSGVLGVMGYSVFEKYSPTELLELEFRNFWIGLTSEMTFNLRVTGGSVVDNTIQSVQAATQDWKAWRLIEVEEVRPVWMLLPKEMQEEFRRKTWHVWPHLLNGKPVLRWYQEKLSCYRSMLALEETAKTSYSYIGEMKDKLPHGIGLKTSTDGTCSEGEWSEGKLNGLAQVTSPNGAVYIGYHRNGKKHGHGKYSASDGSVFEGEWCEGMKMSGVLRYADGCVFEGTFADDHRLHGTQTGTDGSVYIGGFQNGLRHGQATHTFFNGDMYEGEFAEGKFNGHGRFTVKASGQMKEGEWRDGVLAHGVPGSVTAEGEEEGKKDQQQQYGEEGLGDDVLLVENVADLVFMVEDTTKEIDSDYEWI